MLELYENDFKNKGYVEFQVFKPNEKQKKTYKIIIFILLIFILLFVSLFIYILFKNFDSEGIKYFVIILVIFVLVSIILILIFPDKTKYVEWVKVTNNELIIKLQDKRDIPGKTVNYSIDDDIVFKTHYHRYSDDSYHSDGKNLIVNGERFYISDIAKIIELNVFEVFVYSIKNGTNVREEVAKLYKW